LVTLLQGTNTLAYLISLKVTDEKCSLHCSVKIILVANNLAYLVTKQKKFLKSCKAKNEGLYKSLKQGEKYLKNNI
jgi:hypothetical protein